MMRKARHLSHVGPKRKAARRLVVFGVWILSCVAVLYGWEYAVGGRASDPLHLSSWAHHGDAHLGRKTLLLDAVVSGDQRTANWTAPRNVVWNTDAARHPTKLNVHLVCHTHHDPGWLKTVDQYFLGSVNDFQQASGGPRYLGVQYELDGIIHGLLANRDRRYVYGEVVFFKRWYDMQEEDMQRRVRRLVRRGQLDFAGGGWVSNDEAICQYEDIVDQMTLGHRWLAQTFGYIVRQHWQLDPFGHSGVVGALSALGGMDSVFLSRIDRQAPAVQ